MEIRILPESLVVMPVHVARQEVEHGHVHEVVESTALVVGRNLPHEGAIIGLRFPLGLSALVVRASPGMSPYLFGTTIACSLFPGVLIEIGERQKGKCGCVGASNKVT